MHAHLEHVTEKHVNGFIRKIQNKHHTLTGDMFIVACGPISALLRANTYLTLKPLVSNVYSSFSSPQNPRENVAR